MFSSFSAPVLTGKRVQSYGGFFIPANFFETFFKKIFSEISGSPVLDLVPEIPRLATVLSEIPESAPASPAPVPEECPRFRFASAKVDPFFFPSKYFDKNFMP